MADFSEDKKTITLTSEAIENGPPSMKAEEVIEFHNGQLKTSLKLSMGSGPLKVCASGTLDRVDPAKNKQGLKDK